MKHPKGIVFHKIQKVGEEKICTNIIVASELRFGAKKKNSDRLTERLEIVLDSVEVLPFASQARSLLCQNSQYSRKTRATYWGK